MTNLKKTLAKGALGTVAAGAMALASATPAVAKDRDGGIDAGEVIAGALVIGGIAALAGAFDGDKDRYHDRRYRDRNYNYRGNYGNYHYNNNYRHSYKGYNRGNPRNAVDRCVRAAERQAQRFGGYRFADVTSIRDVDRTRNGFKVKGRLVVQGYRGQDRGKFTCWVGPGQRPQIDFDNIRRLR